MLGPGKAFDTSKYFVVCANVLGSCYGTCGPTSINPMTGRPYSGDFPLVTVRDSVGLHSQLLVKHLGVREVFAVVGGSMGGMQALEWTFVEEPPVHAAVALACNGKHNAWQIGFSGKHPYVHVIRKNAAVLYRGLCGCHFAATVCELEMVIRIPECRLRTECQRQAILADPLFVKGQ